VGLWAKPYKLPVVHSLIKCGPCYTFPSTLLHLTLSLRSPPPLDSSTMPDWRSQEELQKDAVVFTKFMHVLLGLYLQVLFGSFSTHFASTISHVGMNGLFLSISSGTSSLAKRSSVGHWSVAILSSCTVQVTHAIWSGILFCQPLSTILCHDRNVSWSAVAVYIRRSYLSAAQLHLIKQRTFLAFHHEGTEC
jgi:hypothetical protein